MLPGWPWKVHDLILSAPQHVVMVLRRCRSLSPKAICNKRQA
jgi:hypothetical protein